MDARVVYGEGKMGHRILDRLLGCGYHLRQAYPRGRESLPSGESTAPQAVRTHLLAEVLVTFHTNILQLHDVPPCVRGLGCTSPSNIGTERHDDGTQRTTPRYEAEPSGCDAPAASGRQE